MPLSNQIMLALLILVPMFSSGPGHAPKRAPQAKELVEQARALPAEFRADTLLRLADSPLIADRTWKRQLVNDAFWSGSRAQLPYQQIADRADSLPTRASRTNGLDALTLQAHAVESLLPVDSKTALDLFSQIHLVLPTGLPCAEVSTPDVSAYYRAAGSVFAQAFSAQQRKEAKDIDFLQQIVTSIDSPSQVPLALQLILTVKVSDENRNLLLAAFGGALEHVSGPDRAYGVTENKLVPAIPANLPDVSPVVPALRAYILRQSSGRRCSDNLPVKGDLPKAAGAFNKLIRALDPNEQRFKSISLEELKPPTDDGTYPRELFWQSSQSQRVLTALQWLHHGNRGAPGKLQDWTLQERSTNDWLEHYLETLKLLDGWKESDEKSAAAYFCMLSDAYEDLAVLAPPGPTRERAMNAYIALLEERYADIENHNLWFTQFRQMLYQARFSKDPKEKAWILRSLSRSSSPVIALYAKLELVLGASPGSQPQ